MPPQFEKATEGRSASSVGSELIGLGTGIIDPPGNYIESVAKPMMDKAAAMGQKTLQTLRQAGLNIPESGITSSADIDNLLLQLKNKAAQMPRISDLRWAELMKRFGGGQ